jgi:hypothetical protein
MTEQNEALKGNPAAEVLASNDFYPDQALVHAVLALAIELRTANILAAQATPDWLNEARKRMGEEPFPPEPGA